MKELTLMKKYRYLFFAALLVLLCACGKTDENSISDNEITIEQTSGDTETATEATAETVPENTDTGTSTEEEPGKTIITVQRISNDSSQTISSAPSEYPFDHKGNRSDEDDSTGFGTPSTFEVSDAMIAVDGTYHTKLSGELLTAINNARKDAGLDVFETNTSLNQVADVRAKEITYSLGHLRADGSYWNTVAPLYYEAECLAQGFTTAADTADAWLAESTTRQYLLSDDLCSIGLSCFEYGGGNYIVASFGK